MKCLVSCAETELGAKRCTDIFIFSVCILHDSSVVILFVQQSCIHKLESIWSDLVLVASAVSGCYDRCCLSGRTKISTMLVVTYTIV